MEDSLLAVGTLLDAVHAQQKSVEAAVRDFAAYLSGLDEVIRGEVRRAFTEECEAVSEASRGAAVALEAVSRAASVRVALWCIGVVAGCTAIPVAVVRAFVPTPSEIAALRVEEGRLRDSVTQLKEQGAEIVLKRCGARERLCVRVDRSAPAYGEGRDYFVAKGY